MTLLQPARQRRCLHFDDRMACLRYDDAMDQEDARKHLTSRFGPLSQQLAWQPRRLFPQQLGPLVALATVATALEDDLTTVTADDLRAALLLTPEAKNLLAIYELDVLHHARKADLGWGEIGALTGIGDRRLAHQRYTRLRNRLAPDLPEVDEHHHREDAREVPPFTKEN